MTSTIDRHIGRRVRALRQAADVSPAAVARALGISLVEYVQREAGNRRFSAFQLYDLGLLLDCSVSCFFDEATIRPRNARAYS